MKDKSCPSEKNPVFIINAGRSGSQFIQRLIKSSNHKVISNHEYGLVDFKPELVKYQFTKKKSDLNSFEKVFLNKYIKKISHKKKWIDSSYVLCEEIIFKNLLKYYPNLKVIHLIRHGDQVVSSWYNKLKGEIYGNKEMKKLNLFLNNKKKMLKRNKKNFWNQNLYGCSNERFMSLSQFEKICMHWRHSNNEARKIRKLVKKENFMEIKLEDFVNSEKLILKSFKFMNIPLKKRKNYFNLTPHNIHKRQSFKLNYSQKIIFDRVCGKTVKSFGYKSSSVGAINYEKKDLIINL